ncbi:serine/threonine protein kinase [Bacillus atrophaeus]|uniref:serine/threonine protein kinase n=1 Tax=Bacillus atrophaeus TaxID=1452 RepID=UPI002E220392|nr:serine/threonine protein kinase [Bacillus atrophaeus]
MLTKAAALAHSVIYNSNSRMDKLKEKPDELTLIGKGRSAYVFAFTDGNKQKALKVFFPEFQATALKEAKIYEKLSGSPYYPDIYETGDTFILMEYIKGYTFYNCLTKGISLNDGMIQQVEDALSEARAAGLNPSDIHLRNLILTKSGAVRVIDVARFNQSKTCTQWDDLKGAYNTLYKKPVFPKKIPAFWLEAIAFLYKKNWFQKSFSERKKKYSS